MVEGSPDGVPGDRASEPARLPEAPADGDGHADGAGPGAAARSAEPAGEPASGGGTGAARLAAFPRAASRGLVVTRRVASGRLAALRRRWPWLRVAVFALVGAVLAVALLGRVTAKVGPFETTMAVRPSLVGNTVVHLSPLGTIDLDTHDWPIALDLRVDEIGVADAERIAQNPRALDRLGDDAPDDVRSALVALALRTTLVAVLGGTAGALVARLRWRAAMAGAGVAGLLVAALGLGTAATFDAEAVAEPRYTGLLTRAPTAVGDIEAVLDRFGEYRGQLSDLVDNMATLYLAGSELPTFEPDSGLIRVLHVSDNHLNPQAFDLMARLSDQFGVDVIADTGDVTDWGSDPETRLVDRIAELDVPYVYVRGNHDSRRTQEAVAGQPNAVVLDGGAATVAGLRFWGIGDPRYTPDKSEEGGASERERAEAFAPVVADRLAEDQPPAVDVVMVHDQRMAGDLGGEVPLVLAGHLHEPAEARIAPREDDAPDEGSGSTADGQGGEGEADDRGTTTTDQAGSGEAGEPAPEETILLVEGSTGGAGLRGLQGEEPEPLTASVLYFDPETRRLVAYDRITVAWLGDAGATIERHIVGDGRGDEDEPAG